MKHRVAGLHPERHLERARTFFIEIRGDVDARLRAMEIGALPVVVWKGTRLRTVQCHGERGRGPHIVNVPESLLWSLIDIGTYRCRFHV